MSRQAGLLAWPAHGDLYLLYGSCAAWTSADAGRSWERRGEIGGQPAALTTHEDDLYVALHTNEVKVSRDGGRTWTIRAQP